MKNLFLILAFSTCFCISAVAQKKNEQIKTGYNFGPVPAIAFDADKGFQFGALCNIYNFGDGGNYPNYNSLTYVEASFFSKGSKLFTFRYDNKVLIPGVRISGGATANIDKAMDFYGFGGYRSYYDAPRVAAGNGSSPAESYYSPFYRMGRVQILGALDFTGIITKHLQWEAGYHPAYFRVRALDRENINRGKEGNAVFQAPSTLFEDYVRWGIIGEDEKDGGFVSALRFGLQYDTRDKEGAPARGIWAEGHLILAPAWLGSANPFYRYSLTMRQYFPLIKNDILTFAYRINCEGNIGSSAPFYILPYITNFGAKFDADGMGGYDTVRGVLRDRVVGLDMATWTAELRWRFIKFVLGKQNIAFGFTVFTDGSMVTRNRDMDFKGDASDKQAYDSYMSSGKAGDRPHITAGTGIRFIMNENFIIAFEYGAPITAFGGPLKGQDGNGAFYVNTGYLF